MPSRNPVDPTALVLTDLIDFEPWITSRVITVAGLDNRENNIVKYTSIEHNIHTSLLTIYT